MTDAELADLAAANLDRAWAACLKVPEFLMLLDDLGRRCSHLRSTADPALRERQQLFLEFIRAGHLTDTGRPSFGFEYFTKLSELRPVRAAAHKSASPAMDRVTGGGN